MRQRSMARSARRLIEHSIVLYLGSPLLGTSLDTSQDEINLKNIWVYWPPEKGISGYLLKFVSARESVPDPFAHVTGP